jgi:Putative transposase, YhgA-like
VKKSRIRQMVRQFPENGMKLLLENPANVRDLLRIAIGDLVKSIDFDGMQRIQTTFVARDYRHVESDVVLTAPRKADKGKRIRKSLLVYILIEHQSHPDPMMPLRMLDYSVQVFKHQLRDVKTGRTSPAKVRLDPVLPVVFYTGIRRWEIIGKLSDLIESPGPFERFTPLLEPVFLNLPAIDPAILESEGGFFGHVLRLVQQRRARPEDFKRSLDRAAEHLEVMRGEDRDRWLEMLSYLLALVYHERGESERASFQERIEESVTTASERRELNEMEKSYAQVLMEQGEKKGEKRGEKRGEKKGEEKGEIRATQRNLSRLLEKQFGTLPDDVVTKIKATRDLTQLETWLDRFVRAESLADVGILTESPAANQ